MQCPVCDAENAADAESCFTCGRSFDALTLGHVLAGRYEIKRPLGKGGMGRVYEAFDRRLEEPVAIKVLRAELSWDPEAARRFLSEIKLARKVTHRNVCRIHEYGEEDGITFISMEYIAGGSLKEHLAGRWPSLDEAYDLTLQIGQGVAAIHEHGIVHRDLKSGNIMVDRSGVAKIVDFGIAKQVGAAGLTAGDKVFGTPEYMSPEQVEGVAVDGRSDVYALGCVTWEIFTGRPPFQGESPYATLLKHLKEEPPLGDLPGPLGGVLAKALAKAPADRFASVADFLSAIRAARGSAGQATGATPRVSLPPGSKAAPNTMTILGATRPPRRRARWLWAAAAAGALAIAIAVLNRPTKTAPEPSVATSPAAAAPSTTLAVAPAPTTTLAPRAAVGPRVAPTPTPQAPTPLPTPTPVPRGTPAPAVATPTPPPAAVPTTTLPAVVTTGTLALILVPDAEVILDGASLGSVGRRELSLGAGAHALEVRHPDYEPLPRRFTIRAAETLTILIDLQEKGIRKAPVKK